MVNIKQITSFCSRLTDIFGYPYYFNWSFPTNFRYDMSESLELDSTYFILRVGKYCDSVYVLDRTVYDGRKTPKEVQLMFGMINRIKSFACFEEIVSEEKYPSYDKYKIKSFEDLELHKKEIIEYIDSLFE